jgi:hypothetical protein
VSWSQPANENEDRQMQRPFNKQLLSPTVRPLRRAIWLEAAFANVLGENYPVVTPYGYLLFVEYC